MKKYLFVVLFCWVAAFAWGQTPITLGNSNMPGSGDTLRYTNVLPLSIGNYTQTGANFTWNFSNIYSLTQGVRNFKSSLLTPYALFFLSPSQYGEKLADTLGVGPLVATNYYDFYKKSNSPNAFVAEGAGVTFSGLPLPSFYSNPDELYNFPMTYPKRDSNTFRFSTLSTTLIPIVYSKTGYRITVVDGWGTITTPYGTDNCLRLVTTQYSKDSLNTKVGPITLPLGFPNVIRSYQWLTTTSKIPYLEVTGSLVAGVFVPTQIRYRGYPPQQPTALKELNSVKAAPLRVYPNPVKERLWLSGYVNNGLPVQIIDLQGQMIKTARPDANGGVDIFDLDRGLYLLKVLQDGRSQHLKFIKD